MTIESWMSDARAHWKQHSPKRFKALMEARRLDSALRKAAERTELEMKDLMAQGYQELEAWEAVREEYLFTPEEGKAKKKNPTEAALSLDNPTGFRDMLVRASRGDFD